MAAQATKSVSVDFHAVAKIVEQPARHVEISFEKSPVFVVCLRDHLLANAKSLPEVTQQVVQKALDDHSRHAIAYITHAMRDTVDLTKKKLTPEIQALPLEIDETSMFDVLIEKTMLVQNRAIGDEQGRLSAAGIARVLADHATSMPQEQREAIAQMLAASKPQESKEQKSDAPKKEEIASLLGVPPPPQDRELQECVVFHMKNLAEHLVSSQPPRIKLVFEVPYTPVDRVQDLVARVEKVEPKMVGMIKAAMARFFKERCIPDNSTSGCDVGRALDAKKKELASRYVNHTIEVDQAAYDRYVEFAARNDLNAYIYAPETDAIFKRDFNYILLSRFSR